MSKFDHLEDLELSDNGFISLPSDISCLKSLTSLNVSGSAFKDLGQVVAALKTIPGLKKLYISLKEKPDFDFISSALPNLELLNDKPVHESKNSPKDSAVRSPSKDQSKKSLNEDDLKEFEKILIAIKEQVKIKDTNVDGEYKTRMITVSTLLNESLKDPETLPIMKKAMNLKAKYAVLDLFFGLMQRAQSRDHANIWSLIKKGQDEALEGLMKLITDMRPEIENEVSVWKEKCKTAQKGMAEVLEMSQKLQDETQRAVKDKNDALEKFVKEQQELNTKIAELEIENKKYLATIVRQSRGTQKSGQSPLMSAELSTYSVKVPRPLTTSSVVLLSTMLHNAILRSQLL